MAKISTESIQVNQGDVLRKTYPPTRHRSNIIHEYLLVTDTNAQPNSCRVGYLELGFSFVGEIVDQVAFQELLRRRKEILYFGPFVASRALFPESDGDGHKFTRVDLTETPRQVQEIIKFINS